MKKIISVMLVLAIALSLCGCFRVDIKFPGIEQSNVPVAEFEPSTEFPIGSTAPTGYDYTEPPVSMLPSSTAPSTAPSEMPSSEAPTSAAPVSQAPAVKKVNEMTKDEIVTFFNTTLNEVKAQKLGFKKSKLTSILDLQLSNSIANSLVGVVKSAILKETAEETPVNKGESSDAVMSPSNTSYVSTITAADVSSFKVTKSGTGFVINVGIKDMSNPDKNSAFGRIFDFITVDDVVNDYAQRLKATVAREDIVVDFKGCYAELTVDANNKIVGYKTYVKGTMSLNNAKMMSIKTDVVVTLASTTDYTNFVY